MRRCQASTSGVDVSNRRRQIEPRRSSVKLEDVYEAKCEEDLVTVGVRESLALFEGHLSERVHEDDEATDPFFMFEENFDGPDFDIRVVRLHGRWRICVIEGAPRRIGDVVYTVHLLEDASARVLAHLSDRVADLYLTLEKDFPREPKESSVDKLA
jgi:hypothetical protein